MALRPKTLMQTPPGLWRWYCRETNTWLPSEKGDGTLSYHELRDLIEKHCIARNVPIPVDAVVLHQICQNLPKGTCVEADGDSSRSVGLTPKAFFQGLKTMVAWYRTGKERVSPELANARAMRCCVPPCPFNIPRHGCKSCMGALARDVALLLAANPKTDFDSQLGACSKCECELRIKVWIPMAVLKTWVNTEDWEVLLREVPDRCWLRYE